MNSGRYQHTATLLPNGKVLLAGGYNGSDYSNTAEVYDPSTGTFTPTPNMNSARYYPSAILLPNGKALVAGGYHCCVALDTAETYNPFSSTFSSTTGNMNSGRLSFPMSYLLDGTVLLTGGYYLDGNSVTNTAERHNPFTGRFTPTANMNSPRAWHS